MRVTYAIVLSAFLVVALAPLKCARAQNAEKSLTTMFGTRAVAVAFLDELKAFSVYTPYEYKDLVDLAIRIEKARPSFSDHQVISEIKAIGDYCTAHRYKVEQVRSIVDILNSTLDKGTFTADTVQQLVHRGKVGDATKMLAVQAQFPVYKMREELKIGRITAQWGVDTIVYQMEKNNHDVMQNASPMKNDVNAKKTLKEAQVKIFLAKGNPVGNYAPMLARENAIDSAIYVRIKARLKKEHPDEYAVQEMLFNADVEAYRYMKRVSDKEVKSRLEQEYPYCYGIQKMLYDKDMQSKKKLGY